jgi:hypothetical protein
LYGLLPALGSLIVSRQLSRTLNEYRKARKAHPNLGLDPSIPVPQSSGANPVEVVNKFVENLMKFAEALKDLPLPSQVFLIACIPAVLAVVTVVA